MQSDEQLARALQAEEAAHAPAASQAQQRSGTAALQAMVQHNESKALSVEDAALQARARSLMPLGEWRQAAQQQVDLNRQLDPGGPTTAVEDLVVQAMLRWFKGSFFSWVDALPCSLCGGTTTASRMGEPTAAERADGAGRVELHHCAVCDQVSRFPRYTSPAKLLQERRGRCGEWAHCFLLMLRAAGLDARHVADNADHVWNEYFSEPMGRWVHVDVCEAAWNTPLLYEGGWGKQLAHVMAASRHGHTDVTKRYVLPAALPQLGRRRAGVPETWLTQLIARATTRLRAGLDTLQQGRLAVRDTVELFQLLALESGDPAAAQAAAAAADLPGRQSGAEAWRVARGEAGAPQRAARPGTPYTLANDAALPALFAAAGRLCGGACRASGEHTGGSPSQVVARLFDGGLGSKWLDFGGGGAGGTAWVEYRLLQQQAPVVVTHYDVICAEDCPERDPCDWVLEAQQVSAVAGGGDASSTSTSTGSGSGSGGEWVVLDRRSGHAFGGRHQLCSFQVPPGARVASRAWRLTICRVADPAAANSVQLACWNLYCSAGAPAGSASDTRRLATAMAAAAVRPPEGDSSAGRGGSGGGGAAADAKAATLQRVLANLVEHPGEAKYHRLSAKAARLQPVLADPVMAAALLTGAGFRPVVQADGELSLVVDGRDGTAAAAAAALLGGGASGLA